MSVTGTPIAEQMFAGTFTLDEDSVRLLNDVLSYDVDYGKLASSMAPSRISPAKVERLVKDLRSVTGAMVSRFDHARQSWKEYGSK